MRLPHWTRLAVSVLLISGAVAGHSAVWGGDASAQTVPAPAVAIFEANCFRSVIEPNDMLCVERFQLPQQSTAIPTPVTTPEAWCRELSNQNGCTSSPVAPAAPESLISGKAFVTLCDLSGGTSGCYSAVSLGTLFGQQRAARIHYALGGIYLLPGHNITWDDPDVQMCIESGTFFTVTQQACLPVDWSDAANTMAAQRADLTDRLPRMVRSVEQQRLLPLNTLVTNGKITGAGRTLAVEAYPFMDTIAPLAFQAVSIRSVTDGFTPATTPSALYQTVAAEATAQAWMADLDAAGQLVGGISGGFFTTLVFLGLGAIMGSLTTGFAGGNFLLGVWVMGWFALPGIFLGAPPPSVVAVVIIILSYPAAWFMLRRIPT